MVSFLRGSKNWGRKLSGDHAGDVAKYKGEVEAIETAQIKSSCKKVAMN